MANSGVSSTGVQGQNGNKRGWLMRFVILPCLVLLLCELQLAILTGCGGPNCSFCTCVCGPAGSPATEPRCGGEPPPFDNSCITSCSQAALPGEQCVPAP